MVHIAMHEALNGVHVNWLEKVTDAEYAKASASEFGIAECFLAFLPKPEILLDDRSLDEWRRLIAVHPNTCVSMTLDDYRAKLTPKA